MRRPRLPMQVFAAGSFRFGEGCAICRAIRGHSVLAVGTSRGLSFVAARKRFGACGQSHVLRFRDRSDDSSRRDPLDQASGIDAVHSAYVDRNTSSALGLEPVPIEPLPASGGDPAADQRAAAIGVDAISDEGRFATEADGSLQYWAGNTAVQVFSPHLNRPRVQAADTYLLYRPLAAAKRVCVVEGDLAFDYSPIKNAEGGDSPESAKRDLYRLGLTEARIESPPDGVAIEY